MKLTGNTVLITGGGSGIGLGIAKSLLELGNQVTIAGRRKEALDQATAANPGMKSLTVDIENPDSIRSFAAQIAKEYPTLNVLINNAGIMRPENLLADEVDLTDAEATINTNLLGPIRLTAALLPLLRKQAASVVMNTSSGLAFVPLAATPTYCATKAALHSYTQSLRAQLKDTTVDVVELIPPKVRTELMDGAASDPRAMLLDAYISEVMEILKTQSDVKEVCVERVKPLRFAVENGNYQQLYGGMNGGPTH